MGDWAGPMRATRAVEPTGEMSAAAPARSRRVGGKTGPARRGGDDRDGGDDGAVEVGASGAMLRDRRGPTREGARQDHPPADLRLLVPALLAWATSAAALGRGPGWPLGIGALLGVTGLALTLWARRPRHRGGRGAGPPWTTRAARWRTRDGGAPAPHPIGARSAGLALGLLLSSALLLRVAAEEHRAGAGPLTDLARDRATVRLEGRVAGEPRPLRRKEAGAARVAVVLTASRVDARGSSTPVRTPVLVLGGTEWADVGWRDVVEVRGRLAPAQPGDQVRALVVTGDPPTIRAGPGAVVAASDVVRVAMREATAPLPADARGLVPAMIIGDRRAVPEDLDDAMRATGMTHLTAVSGTNCSLVVGGAMWLCGWVGVRRRWRPAVGLCVLAGFVVLARPDPSVLRAAVMGAVGLVGFARARRAVGLASLAGAVLLLLAADPWLGRSFGFALSVLATLGLLVFARPWSDALATGLRLPRVVAIALAIPLAAQVMCAPVIVLLQDEINVVGVLTNALAGPLVAPVTLLGAGVAVLAPVWAWGATAAAWAAALPALGIATTARVGETAPLRAIPWPGGPGGAGLLAVVLLVLLLGGRPLWRRLRGDPHRGPGRPRPRVALTLVVVLLVSVGAALLVRTRTGFPGPAPQVVMCDVGQGDAFVLLSGPGRAVVIDAGPDPDLLDDCLDEVGVRVVEAVVLTHFDTDHVGGLGGLARGREVGDVVVSAASMVDVRPRVERWWHDHGHPVHEVAQGDRLAWGGVSALVRGPRRTGPARSPNDGSLVLDVVIDGPGEDDAVRGLFLADAGQEAGTVVRTDLRRSWAPPNGRDIGGPAHDSGAGGTEDAKGNAEMPFDVVKVAHHGSADHDARLLDLAAAPVALVSVGEDNTYGHPTPSLLSHLQSAGSVTYRSDRDGSVAVRKQEGRLLVVRQRGRGWW